jgi:hypothetical protein
MAAQRREFSRAGARTQQRLRQSKRAPPDERRGESLIMENGEIGRSWRAWPSSSSGREWRGELRHIDLAHSRHIALPSLTLAGNVSLR